MTAAALDIGELRRWVLCAAVVLGLHAAGATLLARWHEPLVGDDADTAVFVNLTPIPGAPSESPNDVAPGPLQQFETTPEPEPQPEKPEAKVEEKIEPPPPVPNAEVALPPPEAVKPPDRPKATTPPVPATTAPPRPRPPSAATASWNRKIVMQIERHKGYPAAAQARHEQGVAQLAFTIDRQGKVVASRIVRTSGFALLDQETIATVRRAQPFPPPPPEVPGATFDFTIPIGFHIR